MKFKILILLSFLLLSIATNGKLIRGLKPKNDFSPSLKTDYISLNLLLQMVSSDRLSSNYIIQNLKIVDPEWNKKGFFNGRWVYLKDPDGDEILMFDVQSSMLRYMFGDDGKRYFVTIKNSLITSGYKIINSSITPTTDSKETNTVYSNDHFIISLIKAVYNSDHKMTFAITISKK